MNLSVALLSELKKRHQRVCPTAQYMEPEDSTSMRKFYLQNLEDNFFAPMTEKHKSEYGDGDGGEMSDSLRANGSTVPAKMRALRSSSAMTYNILGNNTCELRRRLGSLPQGTYSIHYEFQSPTLRPHASSGKAHLDALLWNAQEKTLVACEMKMMEWIAFRAKVYEVEGRESLFSAKYHSEANHFNAVPFSVVRDTMEQLSRSKDCLSYDSAQMLKHTLGIINALQAARTEDAAGQSISPEFLDMLAKAEKVVLLNCIWMPEGVSFLSEKNKDTYQRLRSEECDGFLEFKNICSSPQVEGGQSLAKAVETTFDVNFEIEFVAAADLIKALHPEGSAESIYLERYMLD